MRVVDDGGAHIAAVAGAGDCGWSVVWPSGSRLILDIFFDEWGNAPAGPAVDRLKAVFERAKARFVDEAVAVAAPNDEDLGEPHAELLVALIQGAVGHAIWVGPQLATLLRGSQVIARTTPHTFIDSRLGIEALSAAEIEALPHKHVCVRSIRRPPHSGVPDLLTFDLEPGDTLVLQTTSRYGRVLDYEPLAECVPDPEMLVEKIANILADELGCHQVGVAALCFDGGKPYR